MDDEELKKIVIDHYQKGQGSIQDIARVYRLTVDEVLRYIGMEEMSSVETIGDLVSQEELQPGTQVEQGMQHRVPYTTD